MNLINQMNGFDLYFSREYLKAAVMVCLLSVWVLVALFYYLNRYTRRRYFTIWTVAWLFYALWITLSFGVQGDKPQPFVMMCEQWCVGVSAVFLFWGSRRFLAERVPAKPIGWFLVFLLVWSYVGAYKIQDSLQLEIPLFSMIGLASISTARCFFIYRRTRGFIGATLLSLGFLLWGVYMASYPYLQNSKDLVSLALFISAAIQLLVAVSMIILVLEEVRSSRQITLEQLHQRKLQAHSLQDQVTSSEERYRALFEQAGEAILITDAQELRIVEMNHAAERLLGLAGAEAGRHSLSAFCHVKNFGSEVPQAPKAWFEAVRQQRPVNLVRKDGSVVQAEVDGSEITFDGKPAYQFFVRELTERVRLEQQLRQAEKLSALGQMISGVAHELNNPLAIIKGYLELVLSHHDLPAQTRASLEKVAHESDRATKLVRNFLSFAREQSSHREPVDFNEVIRRVIELRRFNFAVAGVEPKVELDSNLPLTSADPDQIQQVLMNLINNALQAMEDKPGRSRLRIRTQHTSEIIRIIVEDNGPGVPEDLIAKIFEPFFTTKEVGTGTGLGLSIAHSIMTEHKGKIFYQPSTMGGAAFVMEFPSTEVTALASATTETQAQPVKAAESHSGRILVLDDEPSLAQMLAEVLDILGYSTKLCHFPAQALELIRAEKFDLIVSDFRMPGMNGQQFYERVKESWPELASRIVFLTGDVANEETQTFLRSTGNPCLDKPFTLTSVERVVAQIMESKEEMVA